MPSSALSCGALAAWTAAAVALQVGGVALFVLGFFPVKPTLPGVSGLESFKDPRCNESIPDQGRELPPGQLRSLYEDLSELSPKYDRLIMMVIDGLPAEFVLGRGNMPPTKHMMDAMPYTQFLLSNKHAIGYHAKAAPPTVTMPRLKAIVSGAVGGFLDVVFNFNTQAFLDDNLLEQFYRIGWRIVMHGDETWIKLFPRFFHRQDGVSSFYVKDTVEVDYNVSRHLDSELAADDWNLLILHYLGLDHAGHIGGRRSDLMVSKLNEMDGVIEKICTSFLNGKSDAKHTLLLVTSDHGMTDEGNHGGSSLEETDSLALFVDLDGQTFHRTSVNQKLASQVDIAPTLALLIGVPIPKNNIGVLLRETFDSLTDGQLLRALELNSWQLLRLLQSQLPGFLCEGDFPKELQHKSSIFGTYDDGAVEKLCLLYLKAIDFHAAWKKPSASNTTFVNTTNFTTVVKAYHEFLRTASKWLSNRATNVAAIYFLSMAGHFALGNSNSIATIDVAGAFTGLSSHSTTLAGILMFCITYASPLLFQISGIMCLPMESLQFSSTPHKSELSRGLLTTIGLPCLVPLALNSFSLTAFTIILLLMRNHLFVWSVFSPKYLYICAATASIYIGVLITATSVTFVFMVLFWRLHRTNSQT